MPHFPKPWFRASRNTWYVEIDGKQHNLGSDEDAAFRKYHELMVVPPEPPPLSATDTVVSILDSEGRAWTTDAVNCAFVALQMRMGREAMRRQKVEPDAEEIQALIPTLKPNVTVKGKSRPKTATELEQEAKRKVINRLAAKHARKYCLDLFRHAGATHALTNGTDALTVAILLGHRDPSTLAKTYQHVT